MAIYITQGHYTSDTVKGMVANPENREKAVADLMERRRPSCSASISHSASTISSQYPRRQTRRLWLPR